MTSTGADAGGSPMRLTTAAALVGMTVLGAGVAAARPAQGQRPDISGRWTFNAAQSDNPRDQMQGRDSTGGDRGGGSGRRGGAYPGMGGGRGGFGGGRGGRGGFGGGREGGGGGGGGGMSEEQRQRMQQTLRLVFQAPAAITIAQTDSTVTLAPDTGAALILPSSGKKIRQEATRDGDGDVEIKGRWQGNAFTVERKVSGGGKVTEDYLRSPDGKQLFVIVSFDNGRGGSRAITFRRIYDGATGTGQ